MPARHERAEALPGRSGEVNRDRAVGQPRGAVGARHLGAENRADRAIHVANRHAELDRLAPQQRVLAPAHQLVVERLLETVILRAHAALRDRRRDDRLVENLREIEARRLPVIDGLRHVDLVHAPDHLVHRPEAELRHQLAHVLGDEAEEVLDELGLAGEALAQLRDPASRRRPDTC